MNNRPVEAAVLRRQSHHIITHLPSYQFKIDLREFGFGRGLSSSDSG
jgi:hypothetical protein